MPAPAPEQEPILKDAMWQVLPDEIESAFAGPDGRAWFVKGRWVQVESDAIRLCIAEQFNRNEPVLRGCRPVLFEPGGRVWFSDAAASTLLGYDGNQWIKHLISGGRICCPGGGSYGQSAFSCIAGGCAFFPDSQGVHVFDTATGGWSFAKIVTWERGVQRTFLTVDPTGTAVVAFFAGQARIGPGARALWAWQKGAWCELPLPPEIGPEMVCGIVAGEKGAWLHAVTKDLRREQELRFIPYDLAAPPELIRPQDDPVFSPGPYSAEEIALDFSSGGGVTWFSAEGIFKGNDQLGPGMVMRDAAGNAAVVLGERFTPRKTAAKSWYPTPIVLPGRKAWVPYDQVHPGELYDLSTGKVIATVPYRGFWWLNAALPDGTLLASADTPGTENTLVAYRYEAADTRRRLDALETPAHLTLGTPSPDEAVLPDGSIVARGDTGMLRFCGYGREQIPGMQVRDVFPTRREGCRPPSRPPAGAASASTPAATQKSLPSASGTSTFLPPTASSPAARTSRRSSPRASPNSPRPSRASRLRWPIPAFSPTRTGISGWTRCTEASSEC